MSIRSALAQISRTTRAVGIKMEGAAAFGRSSGRAPRYFSDDRGRVLSEEERAKETVYIQVVRSLILTSLCLFQN